MALIVFVHELPDARIAPLVDVMADRVHDERDALRAGVVDAVRIEHVEHARLRGLELLERGHHLFAEDRDLEQVAAAALEDMDFLARSIEYVATERTRLDAFLRSFGLATIPSAANFVTVLFDARAPVSAIEAESALSRRGVLVRGLGNYGIPEGLRITVGAPADLERFRAVFAEIMG